MTDPTEEFGLIDWLMRTLFPARWDVADYSCMLAVTCAAGVTGRI